MSDQHKPNPKVKDRIKHFADTLDDHFKNVKIDIMSIDTAVQYYIKEIMQPKISFNDQMVDVPIMYANKGRWTSAQKEGTLRDKNGQIMSPLILFRKTGFSKDRRLAVNKIQADNPQLFYTLTQQYTQENKYDSFNLSHNIKPKKVQRNIIFPDFVQINYDFMIWTYQQKDMNKLLELINFHTDGYWGNERLKFKTEVDNYNIEEQIGVGERRMIMAEFSLIVNGYIIPELYSDVINNIKKTTISGVNITFSEEKTCRI